MSDNTYTTLQLEHRGAALWVTLNRPDALNAFTVEMVDELARLFAGLEADRDTRVVVLRGAGRAFCAGLDLKEFLPRLEAMDAETAFDFQRRLSRVYVAMRRCPQPIVCLWHGAASGGGFALGLASDIRYCTPEVKLNASFVLVGLTGCDVGVSWLLPRLVGASVAAEMLLTGRTIGAERAHAIGLVAEVVAGGSLETTAERTVAELLNAMPLALRLTKQALHANLAAPSFEAAIDLEDRQQTLMALQPEFSARMRTFAARAKR